LQLCTDSGPYCYTITLVSAFCSSFIMILCPIDRTILVAFSSCTIIHYDIHMHNLINTKKVSTFSFISWVKIVLFWANLNFYSSCLRYGFTETVLRPSLLLLLTPANQHLNIGQKKMVYPWTSILSVEILGQKVTYLTSS